MAATPGASGAPIRLGLAAGDRLAVDEIDAPGPVADPRPGPAEPPDGGTGINNVSIVLLGSVGDVRFLLAGDVEEAIDPSLLAEGCRASTCSRSPITGAGRRRPQAFVDAVRPRIAIASAGAGNPYGHPARATLERLAAAGARVFRTDRDGTVAVTFTTGGHGRAGGGWPASGDDADRVDATTAASAARFRCAIPTAALVPEREPPPPPRRRRSRCAGAGRRASATIGR